MASAATYVPIATQTLVSSTYTVTFSSIPSTYTDLVFVINGQNASGDIGLGLRFNSDTSTNYSKTLLYGNGTAATSTRGSTVNSIDIGRMNTGNSTTIININNYTNTTTNKNALARGNDTTLVTLTAGLWRSTAAITSLNISADSTAGGSLFASGCTFTLYGILGA